MELVKSKKRSLTLEPARGNELLPGIHDDITLGHIATKLPWSNICVMSSVSHRWWQAIQNREVYNARVLGNSTDTCIVVVPNHDVSAESRGRFEISLYSMRDKSYQALPVIGPPGLRQLATLDGKVYSFQEELKQLCVLDLAAGQRQWKPCGRFRQPFDYHDFGIMDGKIYIFLSTSPSNLRGPRIFGLEVFDPRENTWRLTKLTQRRPRVDFRVAVVGDEFVVYGSSSEREHSIVLVDIYHPGKDEWRVMNSFNLRDGEFLFVGNERFYSMSFEDIHVYDVQGSSWARLHSLRLPFASPGQVILQDLGEDLLQGGVGLGPIIVVDNELLWPGQWIGPRDSYRLVFIQSIGFPSQNKQLVWQMVKFPLFFGEQLPCRIVPPVQLIRL